MPLAGVRVMLLDVAFFSFWKLASEVKLRTSLTPASPGTPVMNHEHMMVLDAMLCLPGSMGTPITALISAGVRTAQESVTGDSIGAAGGVGERQAERKSAAVRRAKRGFVCMMAASG